MDQQVKYQRLKRFVVIQITLQIIDHASFVCAHLNVHGTG